jgi:hypothetical protein
MERGGEGSYSRYESSNCGVSGRVRCSGVKGGQSRTLTGKHGSRMSPILIGASPRRLSSCPEGAGERGPVCAVQHLYVSHRERHQQGGIARSGSCHGQVLVGTARGGVNDGLWCLPRHRGIILCHWRWIFWTDR